LPNLIKTLPKFKEILEEIGKEKGSTKFFLNFDYLI